MVSSPESKQKRQSVLRHPVVSKCSVKAFLLTTFFFLSPQSHSHQKFHLHIYNKVFLAVINDILSFLKKNKEKIFSHEQVLL